MSLYLLPILFLIWPSYMYLFIILDSIKFTFLYYAVLVRCHLSIFFLLSNYLLHFFIPPLCILIYYPSSIPPSNFFSNDIYSSIHTPIDPSFNIFAKILICSFFDIHHIIFDSFLLKHFPLLLFSHLISTTMVLCCVTFSSRITLQFFHYFTIFFFIKK